MAVTIESDLLVLLSLTPLVHFNMGHIHWQNGEQAEALSAWTTAYRLALSMNLAQALDALEGLAGQLGLSGGLDGWEPLARQMDGAGGGPQAG